MKPLKIILDVQHMGKPHRPLDRGAVHEFDPGIKVGESDLCLQYATATYLALTFLGHHPFLLTHGYYGQRAAFSNQIGANLYLACHLNSFDPPPESNYALIEGTDVAGPVTRAFADYLALKFVDKLPVDPCRVRYLEKGERGYSCINRVAAPALILEPCFINHPAIANTITSTMWKVGDAIVEAVQTFDWK